MNHLKTHQTSLMAPWDPLNAPLDPLGPPGPPHRPPMTPKQVSCPHWTLQITSPAFQIIRWPIKCHCWSYGTSYPSPSGLYSLVLPSSESSPGYISRTYLVQFGLVFTINFSLNYDINGMLFGALRLCAWILIPINWNFSFDIWLHWSNQCTSKSINIYI